MTPMHGRRPQARTPRMCLSIQKLQKNNHWWTAVWFRFHSPIPCFRWTLKLSFSGTDNSKRQMNLVFLPTRLPNACAGIYSQSRWGPHLGSSAVSFWVCFRRRFPYLHLGSSRGGQVECGLVESYLSKVEGVTTKFNWFCSRTWTLQPSTETPMLSPKIGCVSWIAGIYSLPLLVILSYFELLKWCHLFHLLSRGWFGCILLIEF